MKAFYATMLTAATLLAGTAHAHDDMHKTATHKSSVKYVCQGGKRLTVTYGFNKQNLPVYASAVMNGKRRYMPINLNRSDNVETVFGDENNFKLSTDEMTRQNHRRKAVMVTSPGQELIYKSCQPR